MKDYVQRLRALARSEFEPAPLQRAPAGLHKFRVTMDNIDSLVEWQLSNKPPDRAPYRPIDKCPRCGDSWHGLATDKCIGSHSDTPIP